MFELCQAVCNNNFGPWVNYYQACMQLGSNTAAGEFLQYINAFKISMCCLNTWQVSLKDLQYSLQESWLLNSCYSRQSFRVSVSYGNYLDHVIWPSQMCWASQWSEESRSFPWLQQHSMCLDLRMKWSDIQTSNTSWGEVQHVNLWGQATSQALHTPVKLQELIRSLEGKYLLQGAKLGFGATAFRYSAQSSW